MSAYVLADTILTLIQLGVTVDDLRLRFTALKAQGKSDVEVAQAIEEFRRAKLAELDKAVE